MRFNFGYQNMEDAIIAKGSRYVLEKVTNLKEGSCVLTCIATNKMIWTYTSFEDGLNDLAKREYEDILMDIKEYIYIHNKVREY
jgi:hypothetical protein